LWKTLKVLKELSVSQMRMLLRPENLMRLVSVLMNRHLVNTHANKSGRLLVAGER
jgi:hypothetical protein